MRKFSMILLFLFLAPHLFLAQETNNAKEITVIAELIDTKSTGKRHNSFFFTFRIQEVFSGELKDSVITGQEIYNDFGASAIFSKIYPDYMNSGRKGQANEVALCFDYFEAEDIYEIKWVAERYRMRSFLNLENMLQNRQGNIYYNLLQERQGRLFFSENEKAMVAVERYIGSGAWVIAEIKK
jgi:hypothetical protein